MTDRMTAEEMAIIAQRWENAPGYSPFQQMKATTAWHQAAALTRIADQLSAIRAALARIEAQTRPLELRERALDRLKGPAPQGWP